jgi:hypothetical protein
MGEVVCAVVSTDQALYVTRTVNSGVTWSEFLSLGGLYVRNPTCTDDSARSVICALLSTNHALYVNRTVDAGVTWGGFQDLSGVITGNASCTSDDAGGSICAVVASDSGLSVNRTTDGVSYSGLSGIISSDPNCTFSEHRRRSLCRRRQQ